MKRSSLSGTAGLPFGKDILYKCMIVSDIFLDYSGKISNSSLLLQYFKNSFKVNFKIKVNCFGLILHCGTRNFIDDVSTFDA